MVQGSRLGALCLPLWLSPKLQVSPYILLSPYSYTAHCALETTFHGCALRTTLTYIYLGCNIYQATRVGMACAGAHLLHLAGTVISNHCI